MDPKYLVGAGWMGMALAASGLLRDDGLTPEQREQQREAAARREAEATAAKRAASPQVAAAEAKRARKRAKLMKLEARQP